jgi:hypothetical protein
MEMKMPEQFAASGIFVAHWISDAFNHFDRCVRDPSFSMG